MAQQIKNLPAMQKTQVQSLGQEDPLEKEMVTHSSICLGNPMDRGAWWATVHRVTRVGHSLVTKPPYQLDPCTFRGIPAALLSINMYCQIFEKKAVLSDVQKVKKKQDSFQRA